VVHHATRQDHQCSPWGVRVSVPYKAVVAHRVICVIKGQFLFAMANRVYISKTRIQLYKDSTLLAGVYGGRPPSRTNRLSILSNIVCNSPLKRMGRKGLQSVVKLVNYN